MSLPKEPRQKMINLMYLVLTALLALNVSSEILNAFKTVDRSLNTASDIVEQKNTEVLLSLTKLLEKGETREKAAIWKPKADQAKQMADAMVAELEGLKKELKEEAGLQLVDGKEQFKEDDLEAATRLFTAPPPEGKGKGEPLKNSLQAIKDKFLNLDPAIRKELEHSLPIDLTTPEGKSWSDTYFHMTPTIAAITILSKFENDIRNSAAQVIEFCHKQVGQVEVVYDQFQAIASQSSQYLMPGQELVITGGVGAFNKNAQPTVTVDGASVPLNAEGVAEYKTKVNNPGTYSKKVIISFKKPDGTTGSVEKEIKFTVGSPTGVFASAEKVNVLYLGLDNPIRMSGGTKGAEAITATIDNGTITRADNSGLYIANPATAGMATVNVSVDGKSTPFKFPVKRIPNPTPMIGNYGGGTVSVNNFKANVGIRADMGDFIFEGVKFNVSSYTIVCTGKGFENTGPKFAIVNGAYFTSEVKGYIEMCRPGSSVLITDISVEGPDGRRKLPASMAFNLSN
ncbi:MAG: gliding motility protein GldM [Chitinophagaceae bacterium]|nr:gliding motility protein GldM [Chitinophagaceae bacterium]